MLNRMADIKANFLKKVADEKEDRERTEATMINMLELTVQKLNQVKYEI